VGVRQPRKSLPRKRKFRLASAQSITAFGLEEKTGGSSTTTGAAYNYRIPKSLPLFAGRVTKKSIGTRQTMFKTRPEPSFHWFHPRCGVVRQFQRDSAETNESWSHRFPYGLMRSQAVILAPMSKSFPGRKTGGPIHFVCHPEKCDLAIFVKVVQRVPVKIVFDEPTASLERLWPGESVEPKVRCPRKSRRTAIYRAEPLPPGPSSAPPAILVTIAEQ